MKSYYSKEIIEHFIHPKNMGKIKDANGIGDTQNLKCGDIMKIYLKVEKKNGKEIIKDAKFETLGCLPPNEKVLINQGDWEKISSVQKDTKVLNGDGRETQVIKTFERRYRGPILTFVPFASPFNKFSTTPEHPILCIKRKQLKSHRKTSRKCDWPRVKRQELISRKPDYIPANELEKGDYLVFTPNRKIKDDPSFTSEVMKLIGYYLAEGYISAGTVLNFALNKNEKSYITEIEKLLSAVVKKSPSKRNRRSVTEIRICSKKWADFFKRVGGHYAYRKKIADEILILPPQKQWEMLETYIKGDGCLTWRRENGNPRYEITTASLALAVQIQEILARNKIFSAIRKRKKDESRSYIEGRKVNAKSVYDILFQLKRKHKFVHAAKRYFLVPINKIIENKYAGYVHNILVNGAPNSYLVKGFTVHNCGHAIAISDMICDLIKGKTLDGALKVGYQDIVGGIGQVPPQKIHCAHLAQEGVKMAVENYKKRKK